MGMFELKLAPDPPKPDKPSKRPKQEFENTLEGKSAARIAHYENLQAAKVATIEQHLHSVPTSGEVVFIWTTNQFNTMAFIVWIIKHLGPIKDLTITTYSIGAVCINTLMKWYDSGRIEEIYFYIASYAKRIAVKNVDLLTAQANARERITVGYGFNHSKVMLARTENDYIVITGSGNFSENAYNEQYTICNDKRIYDFYYSCIREDNPDTGTERGTETVR